jgi:hypothetical protein
VRNPRQRRRIAEAVLVSATLSGLPSTLHALVARRSVRAAGAAGLARTLPRRHAVAWGAAGGLVIGIVNVGVIGRAFPAIRALPLAPALADNVAFGILFALAVDRPGVRSCPLGDPDGAALHPGVTAANGGLISPRG